MGQELDNTLRERYKKILSHINSVWEFEKEKFKLRADWLDLNAEISAGGSPKLFGKETAAAVLSNKEKLKFIEESISKIREKQVQELDKIKAIIEI